MTITNLIITILAVWEIIEIWRHGSLFAGWRGRVELWEGKTGQLLLCPFCLAPWVSLLVVLWLNLEAFLTSHGLAQAGIIFLSPLYALAAARGANVASDLTCSISQTPHDDRLPSSTDRENEVES